MFHRVGFVLLVAARASGLLLPLAPFDHNLIHLDAFARTQLEQQVQIKKSCEYFNSPLIFNVRKWLVPNANADDGYKSSLTYKAPTEGEIKILQQALKALYSNKDPFKAEPLLTKAIAAWDDNKPPDERAALYHVRADCYMAMNRPNEAIPDFNTAVDLLKIPDAWESASVEEKQSTFLGRARAIRSKGVTTVTRDMKEQAVEDYKIALRLLARGDDEDYDSDDVRIVDGMLRNPYAAWEWGMAKRDTGDYVGAAATHKLASDSFLEIGDKARAVISDLDAGIDLAATEDIDDAIEQLSEAILYTTAVEGRDVKLLQRVIAKEGEARIALASVLWQAGEKVQAEEQLATACVRLEQLEADDIAKKGITQGKTDPLVFTTGYSIDDVLGAGQTSCSRFKNSKFISETLGWPEPLQRKLFKFQRFDTTKDS